MDDAIETTCISNVGQGQWVGMTCLCATEDCCTDMLCLWGMIPFGTCGTHPEAGTFRLVHQCKWEPTRALDSKKSNKKEFFAPRTMAAAPQIDILVSEPMSARSLAEPAFTFSGEVTVVILQRTFWTNISAWKWLRYLSLRRRWALFCAVAVPLRCLARICFHLAPLLDIEMLFEKTPRKRCPKT